MTKRSTPDIACLLGPLAEQKPEKCRNCGGPVPCAAHTCQVCGRDDGGHDTAPHVMPGRLIRVKPDGAGEKAFYIFKVERHH
jgi:hypothetical protein